MATIKEKIEQKIKADVVARSTLTKNLVIRVSDDLHAKLAGLAEDMSKEIPGRRTTISDVARAILEYGLRERKPQYSAWAYRDTPEPKKD